MPKGTQTLRELLSQGSYYENYAQNILSELLTALLGLHENLGIIHRDIKPANIIVDNEYGLKVIDFGLATFEIPCSRYSGTPAYMAPEVMRQQSFDQRADLWSVGVIAYEMLLGYRPFSGQDNKVLNRQYTEHFNEPENIFHGCELSAGAKNFISSLLQPISYRPSARLAIQHEWLSP